MNRNPSIILVTVLVLSFISHRVIAQTNSSKLISNDSLLFIKRMDDLQQILRLLQSDTTSKNAEIKNLYQKNRELQNTIGVLAKDTTKEYQFIRNIQQTIQILRNDTARIGNLLNEYYKEIEKLKNETNELQKKNEILQKQNEELRSDITKLTKDISDRDTLIQTNTQKINELETLMIGLKKDTTNKGNTIKDIFNKITFFQKEFNSQLEQMTSDLDEDNATYRQFRISNEKSKLEKIGKTLPVVSIPKTNIITRASSQWTFPFQIDITENFIGNWATGGNNIGISGVVNLSPRYQSAEHDVDMKLSIGYGFGYNFLTGALSLQSNPFRKTFDKLEFTVNYIYNIDKGFKYYYTSLMTWIDKSYRDTDLQYWKFGIKNTINFASQFTAGFEYGQASTPETQGPAPNYSSDRYVSNFMSPGELKFSVLGLYSAYKNTNIFIETSEYIINMYLRTVLDNVLVQRGLYGMQVGEYVKYGIGFNYLFYLQWDVDNFQLSNKTTVYVGYGQTFFANNQMNFYANGVSNIPFDVVLNSVLTLSWKVNTYMSTAFDFTILYDNKNDKITDIFSGQVGRFLQFQQKLRIVINFDMFSVK